MKVLLVKNIGTEADVMAMAIEHLQEGARVEQAATPQEARQLLSSAEYQVIVCENRFASGDSCVDLYQFVIEKGWQSRFVLISDVPANKIPIFAASRPQDVVARPLDIGQLVRAVARAGALESANSPYCKVSLSTLLLSDGDLKADLYIKLSDDKYVKALPEGEVFDGEDFNRFMQKGMYHLWVKRSEFMQLLGRWLEKLDEAKNDPAIVESPAKVADIVAAAHASVQTALPLQGFTPDLQRMAISSVNLVVKTIRTSPKLGDLLEMLRTRKIPYISAHSVALALMSSRLAFMVEWHNERTFYKLAMAAYLHDITLEEDEWARLDSREKIEASGLAEEVRRKIINHPVAAAELANELGENFADVGNIIEHHHEQSDGSGFPRGSTHKEISQIAALFAIAHEIVRELEIRDKNFSLKDFFEDRRFKEKFDRGSFNQIFRTLHTRIEEEFKRG